MACATSRSRIQILGCTTCNICGCDRASRDEPDARVTHPNLSQEHPDTDPRSNLHGCRDYFNEPLPHADQGQKEEDETFDEDGCERQSVSYRPCAMVADNLVSEVGVEAHARCEGDGEVGEEAERKGANT